MAKNVQPLEKSVQAKPHRSVYQMHRYFARRPYSLFAELVKHYSNPDDIILDPFTGGGVTLVEGLLQGRRVVGFDINPLATFITRMELGYVDLKGLQEGYRKVIEEFEIINNRLFSTVCRHCQHDAAAAWFEYTALTLCRLCGSKYSIAEAQKIGVGKWVCPVCSTSSSFSCSAETEYELHKVYYHCKHCGKEEVSDPTDSDIELAHNVRAELARAELEGLWIPPSYIPDCNMQRESALFKKGIVQFRQLFTDRHLLALGMLKQIIVKTDTPIRDWLLFCFSSTLRYTNRMVTRNESWRKNRPLEWSKPGYWLPPVHLEASVLEEFSKRFAAMLRGKRDYFSKLNSTRIQYVERASDMLGDVRGGYHVSTQSSTSIPLPDNSVDVVITDPPYGSYVHYADLCNFWAVWLPEIEGLGNVIDTSEEAVVARKKFPGAKDINDYQILLERVFNECSRILKPNGYMVLTFHNREPRAWAALLVAAAKAGFDLPTNGILFQDGVASYRHTAQSRRAGSVIGDFVLSFRNVGLHSTSLYSNGHQEAWDWQQEMVSAVREILEREGSLSPNELMNNLYIEFTSHLAARVRIALEQGNQALEEVIDTIDKIQVFDSQRRQLLERHFDYVEGKWKLKGNN